MSASTWDNPAPKPVPKELSRVIRIDQLPDGRIERRIDTNAGEREAIARRLDLPALHSLSAALSVTYSSVTGLVKVAGELTARATRDCVVTLDPFEAEIEDSIDLTFSTAGTLAPADVVDIDPLEDDEPEPLEGRLLDLGEIVVQHLSLALEPHPRKPGATLPDEALEAPIDDADATDERPNPFAALASLKSAPH